MGFFRSAGMKGIYPFLLLALLGSGPFVVLDPPAAGNNRDDVIISPPKSFGTAIASLRTFKILCGLEATPWAPLSLFTKPVSGNDIPGHPFIPHFTTLLTHHTRGPPLSISRQHPTG